MSGISVQFPEHPEDQVASEMGRIHKQGVHQITVYVRHIWASAEIS